MVSIIVPVFNVEQFLEASLESIAAQTFADFECIIVHDGSTDGSGEICDAFCLKDSRFRVIHQQNAGIGKARNAGLDASTGEYIMFFDSDDMLLPTALEVAVNLISSGPYDCAMFDFTQIGLDGTRLTDDRLTEEVIILDGLCAAKRMCERPSWTSLTYQFVWNKLYSRKILGDVRFGYDYTCEDFSFNFLVYQKMVKVIYKKSSQYLYRRNPNGLSKSVFGTRRALARLTMMRELDKKVHVPSFRPVFLSKLYRMALTSRFDLEQRNDLKEYYRIFKPLKKQTFREYLTCPEISLSEKARTIALLWFPGLGRILFRLKYR